MTWLSSKQAAFIANCDERTIRRNKSQYEHRPVNGVGGKSGLQYEYTLESILKAFPEAQARYNGQQAEATEQAERDVLGLTDTQRDVFFAKLKIVRDYKQFKADYPKADKMTAFLRQYNDSHPDKPLNKNKLNHWEKLYDRDGVSGLIDKRGTWNKGVSSIPEDVKQVFLAYWLQPKGTKSGGPSVASCYRLTQMNFPHVPLPSISTFERLTQDYPKAAKTLAQKGKKAYQDGFEPYIMRNYENLHTNQQWTADNHVCDVLVRFPDGHVGRPWVVAFEDMSSRYMVGFHVIEGDPNADHILDAFIAAVGEYGIPEKVQTDNGKDYVVQDLFSRDNTYSLANEMRISVTKAIKYNAKAKDIERGFNTIEYSYYIHLDSYIGANPKKRPEHLNKTNDKLKDIAMPYEDFVQFTAWAIDQYNNSPHSGHGMNGRTPKKAFEENITVPIKIASQELLSVYFQRRTKLLMVGRNGIRVPGLEQWYDDIRLFPYAGQKVFARYKTTDVRYVYCFTQDGNFICTASSVQLGELNEELTAQQMRELNAKKKARMKMIREVLPHVSVPSIQELAIQNGLAFSKPNLKVLPSVTAIDPEKQREAKHIKKEEQRQKEKSLPPDQRPDTFSGLDSQSIDKALAERFKIGIG